MNPKLKKLIDSLNEIQSLELLEYVSDRVRSFNRSKGAPAIDLDGKTPEEALNTFVTSLQAILNPKK